MSEQWEAAAASGLEEVFLSGEFSRVPATTVGTEHHVGDAGAPIGEGIPHAGEPVDDHPLEEVFLSGTFGKEATSFDGSDEPPRLPGEGALASFSPMAAWNIRSRAAAAASGAAAVAMVLSVLASGTGPAGVPSIAADGSGSRVDGGGNGVPTGPGPGASATGPPLARSATSSAASDDMPGASGRGTVPATVVTSAPGGHVGIVPSSTGGADVATFTPVQPATPAPTAAPSSQPGSSGEQASVTTTIGNVLSGASATVTSTANQLGTNVPATAPVVGAANGVGATVNGLGQALALTTT